MEKTRRKLLFEFCIPILVCLAIIVPYENEWLLVGNLEDDKILEYYIAIAMEIITICLIPLSLRLFKFKAIKKRLSEGEPSQALLRWASVRMLMLTLPMMVNCWLYYQFMNVAFGYMGIIDLLCLVFVYPSKTRCYSEVKTDDSKSEQ